MTQNDEVNAFIKKLELWGINTEHNILEVFSTFRMV